MAQEASRLGIPSANIYMSNGVSNDLTRKDVHQNVRHILLHKKDYSASNLFALCGQLHDEGRQAPTCQSRLGELADAFGVCMTSVLRISE